MAIADVLVRNIHQDDLRSQGSHEQREEAAVEAQRERDLMRGILNGHLNRGYQVIDCYEQEPYRVYVLWKKDEDELKS